MNSIFAAKAPGLMVKLMKDLNWSKEDAAACLGNFGAETGGFTQLQEIKPTVQGSKGGYGWAQWTGPRRRSFEEYCNRLGLGPSTDEANYGFLLQELKTTYASTVTAVSKAKTLEDKVVAFERNYEKAGVKNYNARIAYAKKALAAYLGQPHKTAVPAATITGVGLFLAWLASPAGHGVEVLMGVALGGLILWGLIHAYNKGKIDHV